VPKCLSGVIRAAATFKVEWSTSGCRLHFKSDELAFRNSTMRRELRLQSYLLTAEAALQSKQPGRLSDI